MDLRVKRTRKSIVNAFIELRTKKPLEKITVKELADLAVINKATFYLHYQDIYHLSDSIEDELIRKIVEQISQKERAISGPYEITKAFFQAFHEEEDVLKTLFSDTRAGVFANKIEREIRLLY